MALATVCSCIALTFAVPGLAVEAKGKPASVIKLQDLADQRVSLDSALRKLKAEQRQIETVIVMLHDTKRKKDIPVCITYPLSGDKFPVIVFSHGLAGAGADYDYLASYWASHGYACFRPFHDDSLAWNRQRKTMVHCVEIISSMRHNRSLWVNRAEDVSYIISVLPSAYPKLAGKLDESRVGVAGHSLGAFTTLLVAGARVPKADLPPEIDFVRDKRVNAIISISAPGVKSDSALFGFDDRKSFPIAVPAMFLTGDRDQMGENIVEQRIDPFRYSLPGNKYYVSLYGANHMTFCGPHADTGGSGDSSLVRMALDRVNSEILKPYGDEDAQRKLVQEMTTIFWDAYLKGDAADKALLRQGSLTKLIGKAGVVRNR